MYSISLSKSATLFRERIVFLRFSEGDRPISFLARYLSRALLNVSEILKMTLKDHVSNRQGQSRLIPFSQIPGGTVDITKPAIV